MKLKRRGNVFFTAVAVAVVDHRGRAGGCKHRRGQSPLSVGAVG